MEPTAAVTTSASHVHASLFPIATDMPLVINGYQLRDALSLIAPQGTAKQLATTICIQPGPARKTAHGLEPPGLFCWLNDFPEEGSVRLDEHPRISPQALPQHEQMIVVAEKLIQAARWVYRNADTRKQPDARALAKVVMRLTHPIISAHVDARPEPQAQICRPTENLQEQQQTAGGANA